MAKPWKCRLGLHDWEVRENPESHAHFEVCRRCDAERDTRRPSWRPDSGDTRATGQTRRYIQGDSCYVTVYCLFQKSTAAQAAPVHLDRAATVAKACDLIAAAGGEGAVDCVSGGIHPGVSKLGLAPCPSPGGRQNQRLHLLAWGLAPVASRRPASLPFRVRQSSLVSGGAQNGLFVRVAPRRTEARPALHWRLAVRV